MSLYSSILPPDSTVDAVAKSSAATAPKRSLYDGLDAEMTGATVASKAPVTYDLSKSEASKLVPEESEKKQMLSAALQFQPVIRSRSTQSTVAPNKVVTVISKPPTVVPRPVSAVTLGKFATDEAGTTEYARVKQQGRSRKRKKRKDDEDIQAIDWESAYDPLRPNNYDEYLQSEEKFMEDEDWREFLLNLKKRRAEGSVSQDKEEMEVEIKEENADVKDASRIPTSEGEDDETPSLGRLEEQRPSTQPSFVAPGSFMASYQDEQSSTSIAKAPVIFTGVKEAHNEDDESDYIPPLPPSPPSNKPREKTAKETFAKRLLTKYGWTPGTGLGATSGGITKALHFSADKSMKGHGKIVDKNMRKTDDGKFGAMSKVIVLFGIVQPDQLDEDLAGEIGTECGSKYGNVERVYIDEKEDTVNAYVKFTAELSALRAVNGLDGRLFGGNPIVTCFVDEMDFENGKYV
ncbi:hypothetical protein V1506DRAFT_518088 [Lipomyces tetrasporus]